MALWDCPNDAAVTTALASLAPGDVIDLYPGTTYKGVTFQMPSIANGTTVTVRAKNTTFTDGTRVSASATLPILRLTDADPDPPSFLGSGTYKFQGIRVRCDYTVFQDKLALFCAGLVGSYITSVAGLPADFEWRHGIIDGNNTNFVRRGILVHCNGASIHDSVIQYVENDTAGEVAGIGGWNLTGTIDVYNTMFDRNGTAVLIGGGGNNLGYQTLAPTTVLERCYFYWPTNWNENDKGAKSMCEWKAWHHVRVVGCVFENYRENLSQTSCLNFSHYGAMDEGRARGGKGFFVLANQFLHIAGHTIGANTIAETEYDPARYAKNFVIAHNVGSFGKNMRTGAAQTAANAPIYIQAAGGTFSRNTFLLDDGLSTAPNAFFYTLAGKASGLRMDRNVVSSQQDGDAGLFITCESVGWGEPALNGGAGTNNWSAQYNATGGTYASNPATTITACANNTALRAAVNSDWRIATGGALGAYATTIGADVGLMEACTAGAVSGSAGTSRIVFDRGLMASAA